MDIIPAIDLLDGRCVRLLKGDFDQVTQYDYDPRDLAARYAAAGCKRLHVVDLDGARSGKPEHTEVIAGLAADFPLEIQSGGGIRDLDYLETLLSAGVKRGVVGSVAVKEPRTVFGWMDQVGADSIVLALDVQIGEDGTPWAATHGWTETSGTTLWELMETYLKRGARHFLCTDIARDGMLQGPNTELYAECVQRFPEALVQASGGVSSAAEFPGLVDAGANGVITGKALLEGRITTEEIEQFSRDA